MFEWNWTAILVEVYIYTGYLFVTVILVEKTNKQNYPLRLNQMALKGGIRRRAISGLKKAS